MKRFVPLFAVVTALATIAVITAVAVGASSGGPGKNTNRQSDEASGGDIAAACLEGTVDCVDTVDGDAARCVEGADDCVDTIGSGSMNMCIAPDDASDAVPECNDMVDCAAVEDVACSGPMPAEPSIAIDPICIDDGSGRDCIDDGSTGSRPPSGPATTYDLTIVFNESVTQTDLDETVKVITEISPDTEFLVRESFPPVGVVRITTDMASFCPDIEAKLESASYIAEVTCAVSPAPDDNPPPDPDEPVSSEPSP